MPRQPSKHVDSPRAVGDRLYAARERAGLSQRDLAFPGCTPAYISRIEAGLRVPSLQILRQLGERLGVTADYLATGVDPSAPSFDPLAEAQLAARLDDVKRARRLYKAAIADSGDEGPIAARAHAGLGHLAFDLGDHTAAVSELERALGTEGLLPVHEAGVAVESLGRAYALRGEFELAFALFERALTQAREREDLLDLVRFTALLANAYVDSGNVGRAAELLGEAIGRVRDVDDPLSRARVWWTQSRLHTLQNQPELAARYARLAIAALELTDYALHTARAYQLLAHIENDRGNSEEALGLLEQGEARVIESGNVFEAATFRLERARALVALGREEEAAALAMAVGPMFTDASPTDAGRGYGLLAGVYRQLGDHARALELYELAIETLLGRPLPARRALRNGRGLRGGGPSRRGAHNLEAGGRA